VTDAEINHLTVTESRMGTKHLPCVYSLTPACDRVGDKTPIQHILY